jgi:hypothetical protein
MAVGFIDGRGGLAEVMKVTALVWHIGAHLRDGTAEGPLAIRNDADKRHRHVLTHGPEQYGEVGLGRGQPTTGEEDFPGEAIPEDPQHLMADVRLEAIERQDDPALGLGDPLQAGGVRQRAGEQCVVPFEPMAHGPWGDGHTALAQVVIECGHTAMLRVTQGTDRRHDIKATRVLGSGQATLCFRTVGTVALRTAPVETAPDVQGERHHVVQGRERARVMRGGPHGLTADGAMTSKRLEGAGSRWDRTRGRTCHGESFPVSDSPF